VSPPTLVALARRRADGQAELLAPAPGFVVEAPRTGGRIQGGEAFATLEILGRRVALLAPAGVDGLVVAGPEGAPRAVGAGGVVATLGAFAADAIAGGPTSAVAGAPAADEGLFLRASSSGRFYRRPAPGKPALVDEGAILETGQAIGLIEVMKTFSRIPYGGSGLPARARVVRVVPADGADVEAGDVLLELEPLAG
jgi:acetyl-CoA carboxylase biotin carboxyl carrier protein